MNDSMAALDLVPTIVDGSAPTAPAEPPVRCGSATLRGKIHARNEDRTRAAEVEDATTLIAVADGLGSGDRGDLAAEHSLRSLFRAMRRYLDRDRGTDAGRYPELLQAAAGRANLELWLMRENLGCKLGATLCAALVAHDGRAWVINAGDTRCYHVRGTRWRQITRDHSLVQEMVDKRMMPRSKAPHHPWRNLVTRSLGRGPDLDYDLFAVTLEPGDTLMLVSDGIWDPMAPSTLVRIVRDHDDPGRAAGVVASAASQVDGRDDMTCAMLRYC